MSARQGGPLLGERLLLERGRDGGDGEPGRPGLDDEGLAVEQVLLEDLSGVQDVVANLFVDKQGSDAPVANCNARWLLCLLHG